MVDYVSHEHEGDWIPPSTIGGTCTRCCTICGLYETSDLDLRTQLPIEPKGGFFSWLRRNTANTGEG